MEELELLAADCPDGVTCQLIDIGLSYQGRPITQLLVRETTVDEMAVISDLWRYEHCSYVNVLRFNYVL